MVPDNKEQDRHKVPAAAGPLMSLEDGSLLSHCQSLYKIEMRRLRIRHWTGPRGEALGISRRALIDAVLEAIWQASQNGNEQHDLKAAGTGLSLAWMALGEHGSQDLGPFSPVELLILEKPATKGHIRSRLD